MDTRFAINAWLTQLETRPLEVFDPRDLNLAKDKTHMDTGLTHMDTGLTHIRGQNKTMGAMERCKKNTHLIWVKV